MMLQKSFSYKIIRKPVPHRKQAHLVFADPLDGKHSNDINDDRDNDGDKKNQRTGDAAFVPDEGGKQ